MITKFGRNIKQTFKSNLFFCFLLIIFIAILYHLVNKMHVESLDRISIPQFALITSSIAFISVIFNQICINIAANRNKAFEVINYFTKDKNALKHIKIWRKLRKENLEEDITEIFSSKNTSDNKNISDKTLKLRKQYEDSFIFLANFYEELAILISYNMANEELLREYFKEMVINFASSSEATIQHIRKQYHSNNAFMNLEKLATRWQ